MILRHSINTSKYDYDEYDYEEAEVHISYLHNEDEEDDEENTGTIDDEDIMETLKDARIGRKSNSTTIKKKKKITLTFSAGEQVIYKKKKATVIFGPYEKDYKQIYELQTEDKTIVSAIATSIKKA